MHLPPLLNPILDTLARTRNLLLGHRKTHLTMRLARLNEMLHALLNPEMILRHHGELLLVLPDQIAHILRRSGNDIMRCHDTGDNGCAETEEDISVSADDAAGHCGDEDVYSTWKKFLVGLFWRCQVGDGLGEGVFGGENAVHAAVDCIFGFGGVAVQCETGAFDLLSKPVGGCWAAGSR